MQDIHNTWFFFIIFFFAIKQLKPLVHLSLFTSDKICSDMRVEALPFSLLTFHFRPSDTTRIKTKAETPQTISSNIPLSAQQHRGQRQGQTVEIYWEMCCIYCYVKTVRCIKNRMALLFIPHFSYIRQSKCFVLGCVNPTSRQMFLLTVHSDTMWQWLKTTTYTDDGAGVLARVMWEDLFKNQLAFILSSGDFFPVLLPDKLHSDISEVVDTCESDGFALLCVRSSAVDRSLKVWWTELMKTVRGYSVNWMALRADVTSITFTAVLWRI